MSRVSTLRVYGATGWPAQVSPRAAQPRPVAESLGAYLSAVGWCAVVAGGLAFLLRLLGLNPLGFEQMVIARTWCVLAMFLYLLAGTWHVNTPQEILFIGTVPFLTQFYQVALGREFPEGATSWMRLLPLLVMTGQMGWATLSRKQRVSTTEFCIGCIALAVSLIAFGQGATLSPVGPAHVFLIGVLIPVFCVYCGSVIRSDPQGAARFFLVMALNAMILLSGFIGTVLMGLDVEIAANTGTLVGTRNLGDFNAMFPYLLLLYPFAFVYARQLHPMALTVLFVLVVFAMLLGFSRTAFLLLPILLGISLLAYLKWSPARGMVLVAIAAAVSLGILRSWSQTDDLLMTWIKRFDLDVVGAGNEPLTDLLEMIAPGSVADAERAGLRAEAIDLFEASPLVGNGWGSQLELAPSGYCSSHSMIHDWLAETGLVGTAALVALLVAAFWTISRAAFGPGPWRADAIIAWTSFVLWLLVTYRFGGNLYVASREGFTVNAVNGLLLTLYLRPELIARFTARRIERA